MQLLNRTEHPLQLMKRKPLVLLLVLLLLSVVVVALGLQRPVRLSPQCPCVVMLVVVVCGKQGEKMVGCVWMRRRQRCCRARCAKKKKKKEEVCVDIPLLTLPKSCVLSSLCFHCWIHVSALSFSLSLSLSLSLTHTIPRSVVAGMMDHVGLPKILRKKLQDSSVTGIGELKVCCLCFVDFFFV